jgi:enterochelin esterase family protein
MTEITMQQPMVVWIAFAALITVDPAAAQQRPGTRPAPVVSPEVHADRTVTLRLRAPAAKEVKVAGEWPGGTNALTKDERGLWSITVGPLAPDVYGYSFVVDGFRTLDPANRNVKPMRSPTTSILEVPGDPPRLHEFQNVPHGTVRLHEYQSKAVGRRRGLYVYTPPGYDRQADASYPVLYLFHGSGDTEATWTVLGRAHVILDNLLAQQKAQPMVIVMPDGHAAPTQPVGSGAGGLSQNLVAFQKDLLEDVLPFVEAKYRVRREAASRAIVGLSMGGGQSLTIGLKHPELFGWVGGFSAAVFDPETTLAGALADPWATNGKLRLLWFACGKDDRLVDNNRQLAALLQKHGIRHEFRATEGNHSWPVWRRYLAEFIPLLFTGDATRTQPTEGARKPPAP